MDTSVSSPSGNRAFFLLVVGIGLSAMLGATLPADLAWRRALLGTLSWVAFYPWSRRTWLATAPGWRWWVGLVLCAAGGAALDVWAAPA